MIDIRTERPSDSISDTLANVRGLLLDVDGVLHVGMQPIPGAAEALNALTAAGLSYRLVTNTTTASRATLGKSLRKIGLPVRDDDLITAPVATAAYLRSAHPDARCYLIAKGDVAADFRAAGLALAGDKDDTADVVVVGGAEERLTYDRLNRAFRMLMGGARLVAMHRNRFWRTADGLTLDSGPFVGALEEASGVKAVTVGKPALPFFRQALRDLAIPPHQVLVIGDDAANDLAPARRLGCRTLLVRTGKPVGDRAAAQADLVLDSIADLPPLLC